MKAEKRRARAKRKAKALAKGVHARQPQPLIIGKRSPKMDIKISSPSEENLWRLETYDDTLAGSIIVRVPVKIDGSLDLSREPKFRGGTFIQGGKIRIEFDLSGPSLTSAIASWPEKCLAAIQEVQSQMFKSALLDPSGAPLKPQA
jgi:hypothetical protein